MRYALIPQMGGLKKMNNKLRKNTTILLLMLAVLYIVASTLEYKTLVNNDTNSYTFICQNLQVNINKADKTVVGVKNTCYSLVT